MRRARKSQPFAPIYDTEWRENAAASTTACVKDISSTLYSQNGNK